MKKGLIFTCALALTLICMTACKGKGVDVSTVNENTLIIHENGSITEVMVDSFEEDYYSQSELNAYIDEHVNDYNRSHPSSSEEEGAVSIKKDKVLVEGDKARVELTYEGADDYAAFNLAELELPTADNVSGDAMMLKYRDAEGTTVSYSGIDNLEKYKAVIVSTSVQVVVDGEIAFVSDNVSMIDNSTAKCEGALSVIIYK